MSKRSWGTGFAIGLGSGVGLALFFLVWAVPEFRNPSLAEQYYQNWQATSDPGQNQNPDDAHFWVRELHGWAFAEDSLAQWLMAMLGFAATAISLYALIWLKRTWDQTKSSADAAWKAVAVAEKIGNAEMRPWVVVALSAATNIQPAPNETSIRLRINLKNVGKSAATQIFVAFESILHHSIDESRQRLKTYRFERIATHKKRISSKQRRYSIAPGQSINLEIKTNPGIPYIKGNPIYALFLTSVIYEGNGIEVDGTDNAIHFADTHAAYLLRVKDDEGALGNCILNDAPIPKDRIAFEFLTDGTIT